MLLRVKEESVDELTGFLSKLTKDRLNFQTLRGFRLVRSYAGKREHYP